MELIQEQHNLYVLILLQRKTVLEIGLTEEGKWHLYHAAYYGQKLFHIS